MKTNTKYALVSSATALAVVAMSLSAFSFAQTVVPVVCSSSAASVVPNQSVTLTATGGNGVFVWSGPNLSISNAVGTQFAVSYPSAGTYPITVTSAGFSAVCNVTVAGTAPVFGTGTLVCSPAVQNVVLGTTATVSAAGGNGTYSWSSPDLTVTNAAGSGFNASFASTGLKTLTVASNGLTSSCLVNVLAAPVVIPPVVTPGLPDTGGGYNQ